MGNYFTDILSEKDPVKKKENLDKLIAERMPSELLALTAISVLSDDSGIRRTALERIDERNREEGNAAARVISLIQSWRREGALMTWPEPMDGAQKRRAAEKEAAYHARSPLSLAVREEPELQRSPATSSVSDVRAGARSQDAARRKPWWKFW